MKLPPYPFRMNSDNQHRLEKLEAGLQWLYLQQLIHEAKLQSLIQELIQALERAGTPTQPFQTRLKQLETMNLRDLLKQMGKSPDDGPPPPGPRS